MTSIMMALSRGSVIAASAIVFAKSRNCSVNARAETPTKVSVSRSWMSGLMSLILRL